MNNKRRHILCILILIMTSLFFSSCGEPSLCTLSGITLSKGSYSETAIPMTISGSDTDLDKLTTGPGLLLCYFFEESPIPTHEPVSSFADLVKRKLIIGENNSILTFGDNNTLYAFQKDLAGSSVSSPSYCYNLYGDISGTSINKSLTLTYESNRRFTLDGTPFYTKEIPEQILHTRYIHIYGAFSAEQGSFSNNYWSSLVYLGSVPVVEETT